MSSERYHAAGSEGPRGGAVGRASDREERRDVASGDMRSPELEGSPVADRPGELRDADTVEGRAGEDSLGAGQIAGELVGGLAKSGGRADPLHDTDHEQLPAERRANGTRGDRVEKRGVPVDARHAGVAGRAHRLPDTPSAGCRPT